MNELLNRFSFSSARWNSPIALCLLAIWLAIVVCAISSIRAQGFGPLQRRFWIGVVVFLPVLGLLAYLPFSLRGEDSPGHRRLRAQHRRAKP